MNLTYSQPKTKSNTGVVIFVGFLGVSSCFDVAARIIRSGIHATTSLTLVLHLFDLILAIGSLLVVLSFRKPNFEQILNAFFAVYFVKFAIKTLANHDYLFFGVSVLIIVVAWLISRSRDSKPLAIPHA